MNKKQTRNTKTKRKTNAPRSQEYQLPDHVTKYTELDFDGEVISPGQKVKIKNRRGTFTYRGWAHNSKRDVQWLELIDDKTGQFRQFYVDQLRSVVRPKRSRAKKVRQK